MLGKRASLKAASLSIMSKRASELALMKMAACLASPEKPQRTVSRRDSSVSAVSTPWSRHLKSEFSVGNCVIVSEILDSRTRNLINELHISEYVMSNELVSKALAMVSESTSVNHILKELFTKVIELGLRGRH